MKSEIMHPDENGKMHRFKDIEQADSEYFHIAQADQVHERVHAVDSSKRSPLDLPLT